MENMSPTSIIGRHLRKSSCCYRHGAKNHTSLTEIFALLVIWKLEND